MARSPSHHRGKARRQSHDEPPQPVPPATSQQQQWWDSSSRAGADPAATEGEVRGSRSPESSNSCLSASDIMQLGGDAFLDSV